jgi:hypothetical protein
MQNLAGRRMKTLSPFFAAFLFWGLDLHAEDESFYKDKSVKIIVGFTANGAVDPWRTLKRDPSRAWLKSGFVRVLLQGRIAAPSDTRTAEKHIA